MPYISRVYKDTEDMDHYLLESTVQECFEEVKRGNIPIVIRWTRRHILFYVSPDASIEDILTSFHHQSIKNMRDIDRIVCMDGNPSTKMYSYFQDITQYNSSLESLFSGKTVQIVIMNRQNDRE